jgi:hypothetical protein
MAPQVDRQMKITNISSQNLGCERPLSLFLRRKPKEKNDKLAYRSSATVAESQIPPSVLAWQKQGLVTITPVKGDVPPTAAPGKVPSKAEDKAKKKREAKPVTKADDGKKEEKGDFSDAVTTTTEAPAATTNVDAEEEAPKAEDEAVADMAPPADKEKVGSVGSDAGGGTAVTAPTAPAEEAGGEESAADTVFTQEQLDGMNMKELRQVVKDKELGVRANQKAPLIGAILASQTKDPEDE